MVTDVVVLALLTTGPMHGYEIKKKVSRILERETALNNNALYPALHRLESAGSVSSTVQEQEQRPNRRVYRITDRGRAQLRHLVADFDAGAATREHEFLTRVAFFDLLDDEARSRVLRLRREALEQRLDRDSSLGTEFSREFDAVWVDEVLQFRRRRLREEIAWIEELQRRTDGATL